MLQLADQRDELRRQLVAALACAGLAMWLAKGVGRGRPDRNATMLALTLTAIWSIVAASHPPPATTTTWLVGESKPSRSHTLPLLAAGGPGLVLAGVGALVALGALVLAPQIGIVIALCSALVAFIAFVAYGIYQLLRPLAGALTGAQRQHSGQHAGDNPAAEKTSPAGRQSRTATADGRAGAARRFAQDGASDHR